MSRADSIVRPRSGVAAVSSGVIVDTGVCATCAELIKGWRVPPDREESSLLGLTLKQIGNFYFLLVSICHQTSAPGRPPLEGVVHGRRRRGWDYLHARLEAQIRLEESLLTPERWQSIGEEQIEALFRDEQYSSRLSNLGRRAELVRDLGNTMRDNEWNSVEDMYDLSCHRVATGEPNLLQLLSLFAAYSDPVRKKSLFFLSLMRNSGLWSYVDDDNLGPPVDYHEVRGHLRIGTVRVTDPDLRNRLLARRPVTESEDIAIRSAVYDAIMLISGLDPEHNPSRLHYLFWNVFRSCCTREEPHCQACKADCDLPDRYVPLALAGPLRRCPFASVCASATTPNRYYEHVFETDYY